MPPWGGGAACAFPCVQPDVMVISACGQERRLTAKALRDGKAQDTRLKPNRAVQIRDLEMDMPNCGVGVNICHIVIPCVALSKVPETRGKQKGGKCHGLVHLCTFGVRYKKRPPKGQTLDFLDLDFLCLGTSARTPRCHRPLSK